MSEEILSRIVEKTSTSTKRKGFDLASATSSRADHQDGSSAILASAIKIDVERLTELTTADESTPISTVDRIAVCWQFCWQNEAPGISSSPSSFDK